MNIHQRFFNNEPKALEVVYKFPLPESSSICGFKITIGERTIQGEIEERQNAFKLYDEALSRGDGAFLLDQERPNIFTLSLGNINPGVSVSAEIDYVTLLDAHNTEARFFLPTTISPRYLPPDMKDHNGIPVDEYVNPPLALDVSYGLKILLDIQGRDNIKSLDSPSHHVATSFVDNSIRVELTSENTAMDRDFVLNIRYQKNFETAGYLYRKDESSYIQVDFSPKPCSKSSRKDSPSEEIIFVLDCSGSMTGSSIIEAKRALEILIRDLETGTRFNIYRFGSTFSSLFNTSLSYDAQTRDAALKYLSNVNADLGGTEILAPLQAIQRSQHDETISSVILLTDGQVGNEEQIIDLVRARNGRMRMFTVGIGNGPNEYFIKQLAKISGGASELIAPNERIEPGVLRLFSKVSFAGSIQDFKVNWGTTVIPARVPTVAYGGETISMFAKVENNQALPKKVILSGIVNKSSQEWVASITQIDADNSPLPSLWARSKILELEESETTTVGSKQYHRKEGKVKQAIVDISQEYGIISRETSFVAVERRLDAERTTGEVVLRKVPVMLTHGWGALRERVMISQTADNTDTLLQLQQNSLRHGYQPLFAYTPFFPTHARRPQISYRGGHGPSIQLCSPSEDKLLHILSLQKADGGFEYDETLSRSMMFEPAILCYLVADCLETKGESDKLLLLFTAVVLAVLDKQYTYYRKVLWRKAVQKSRTWLKDQIRKYKPTINGKKLEDWVDHAIHQYPEW
ncbi:MAG: VIT domain-containing protein [Dehalococcoidales bacterium]|nr:VIT domain-containing protein [Dehalococcoidales bacterium]